MNSTTIHSLVEGYFTRHGRPKRGSQILCAVSGGPDSVALLHVLHAISEEHRWMLGVAHVNHALRGAESDGDERFVRGLATTLGLRYHVRRLDPTVRPQGSNFQAWAREQRYRFFDSTADHDDYDFIALAHQLDDRAETVAAAVLDAGGTFALSGIPPIRGRIIRPLFDVPRELVVAYLMETEIEFREDQSNRSDHYQRNRIRNEILPAWKRENPAAVSGLARLGEQLWLQRQCLERQARHVLNRAMRAADRRSIILDALRLGRYDSALDPFVLRELVTRLGGDLIPTASTVSRFESMRRAHSMSGEEMISQHPLRITLSKGQFRVELLPERRQDRSAQRTTAVPKLETQIVPLPATFPADDTSLARFDLDALAGEITVRWPKAGDRYQPIGLRGTKKLFDLLADRAVPSYERPLVPVVVDNAGILWPVGHPIAQRARLTSRTRRVLEARVREGSWKKKS